ncbi:MAG TPA: LytTR family DNA-binding domain-containing protein [Chitinophagaceae bacterium]|jgi:DNA-binding LytR/AlgR family response regulator|nr:LytTR family DNA-binding domain-containing protein [Chitinophagaceae bacterium]
MKVLIVEDEELAVEKLQLMILAIEKDVEIVGTTGSIKKTVEWLQENAQPDIILMDIELSDGHSFEIFNQVTVDVPVIFTTSYDEYALKAFKVNSIDYLLKPIQKSDLKLAFDKYRKLQLNNSSEETASSLKILSLIEELQSKIGAKDYRNRFLVKQGQKQMPVEVDHIAYFYIFDRALFLKTLDNKKFIIDFTLDEVESMLDPARFFRINRSLIVSIKSIIQLHDYFNSRLVVTLHPPLEEKTIVSREKVNDFKKWIGK